MSSIMRIFCIISNILHIQKAKELRVSVFGMNLR